MHNDISQANFTTRHPSGPSKMKKYPSEKNTTVQEIWENSRKQGFVLNFQGVMYLTNEEA